VNRGLLYYIGKLVMIHILWCESFNVILFDQHLGIFLFAFVSELTKDL